MATDTRQILGKTGEDLACAELERRGYAILARRYRTRFGEIDIIARDTQTIVFVEVKARQGRIATMALDYIARHHLQDCPCRFDAVTVDFQDSGPRVTVYPDAFGGP